MRRTIHLARHASHAEVGQILSGRSDIALNERGRSEADRLARRLAHVPLAAIHASPRRRARETADIVAETHSLEVNTVAALDEIDFGVWSGQPFAVLDAQRDWQRWNAARATAATPAGETMASVTSRALDHILAIPNEGAVLCVSHCDVIRGIVARVLGLGFDRMFAFDCDPASLTTIEIDGASMRLATLNERPQ